MPGGIPVTSSKKILDFYECVKFIENNLEAFSNSGLFLTRVLDGLSIQSEETLKNFNYAVCMNTFTGEDKLAPYADIDRFIYCYAKSLIMESRKTRSYAVSSCGDMASVYYQAYQRADWDIGDEEIKRKARELKGE